MIFRQRNSLRGHVKRACQGKQHNTIFFFQDKKGENNMWEPGSPGFRGTP